MQISVTQQDINVGIQGSCTSCPIAIAIKRVVDHAVQVGKRYITTDKGDFYLPWIANEFIVNFDSFEDVEPFEFDLLPISQRYL